MSRNGRRLAVLCLACLLVAGWCLPAMAQMQGLSAQRLVRLFDFEEARLGNFEDLPQHWYVIGRPANSADPNFMRLPLHEELVGRGGYPHFTQVRFDRPQIQPGPHAFHMKLDGGNVGAFLEVGAVPAVPMSEYMITVRVRTQDLRKATARFSAYLVDKEGNAIPGSLSRSPRVQTGGGWEILRVPLRGEFPNAAWVGMELELLQPQPDPDSPLGNEQIVIEDIQGEVWWDDLTIWQLPQVSVQTQSPVNFIRSPHLPKLSVRVRDLTGNALLADVHIYDAFGREVEHIRRMAGEGDADLWQWTPKLEKYGWYLADLTVYDTAKTKANLLPGAIARSVSAFLWLPAYLPMDRDEASRFMLLAAGASEAQSRMLPQLLKATGLQDTTLSLWEPPDTMAMMPQRQAHLDAVINPILGTGGKVMLSVSPAPEEMLVGLDVTSKNLLEIWAGDRSIWQPYMLQLLMRHGQSVSHWQLGSLDEMVDPAMPDLGLQVYKAYQGLQTMAPDPQIVLPWRIDFPRPRNLRAPVSYFLNVPPAVQAEHLGQYLQAWTASPMTPSWLVLREPPPSQMPHEDRLVDYALRMIHAWEGGAHGLAIDKPWAWVTPRQLALMPDSLLGAFTQISQRLAGRKAVGRLDIGRGLECVIFDGEPGGMLAMWNRSSTDDVLELYLGQMPVQVDIWGNRERLLEKGGKHHVKLSRMPIFIEDIDARLALMRASFKLDEPFIESTQTPHRRVLTLTNPWTRAITGTMNITGPAGWRMTPSSSHFSIGPGQTITLPVQMTFPVSEVAGHKRLVARLEFMAEQMYTGDFYAPMELGLRDIQFDASVSYRLGVNSGKVEAVITQFVTNLGSDAVSLYAFVQTAGFPRQEGIISRLAPGQSIIRRFVLENVSEGPQLDQPLRVGLRETRGPAVLNQMLRLMPPAQPTGPFKRDTTGLPP